jgi:3-keto-disaccharide hydrolase
MTRTWLSLALMFALAPCRSLPAADEGFRPLFNGKDFTGWITPDDKSIFSVENGEIVGRSTSKDQLKKNEFLVTDRPYGDFVLKVKVKLLNHNSGVQFRSKRAPDGAVSGPQADAADGYWGLLYEERGRGILERYPKEKANALVKNGDWNEYIITAKGDHVTIKLNGTTVIDRTDPKFDKTGVIALQMHAGMAMEVRFKDLEIKVLD